MLTKRKYLKIQLKDYNTYMIRKLVKIYKSLEAIGQSYSLVHRDIKPANILLTQRSKSPPSNDVKAVICDFGLSSELEEGRYSKTTTEIRGTLSWIAPEMFNNGKTVSKNYYFANCI